jgi:hypothetical protein
MPVTGDVTRDLVPERYGGDNGQSVDRFLVMLEIIIELIGILLQYLDRGPFDEGWSDISHWIHL